MALHLTIPQDAPLDVDCYVGERIRARRKQLGLHQMYLATVLDVSQEQVSKYERGQDKITAGPLYLIADALDVPVTWFFAGLSNGGAEHDPLLPELLDNASRLPPAWQDAMTTLARAMARGDG